MTGTERAVLDPIGHIHKAIIVQKKKQERMEYTQDNASKLGSSLN